jgi:hypothetical protein
MLQHGAIQQGTPLRLVSLILPLRARSPIAPSRDIAQRTAQIKAYPTYPKEAMFVAILTVINYVHQTSGAVLARWIVVKRTESNA